MIKQLTEDICEDNEEREIVSFGLERLKVALVALILVIITGVLLRETARSILLIACLLPLRQNAGGYHMQSSRICAFFSYAVMILSMLCIKFLYFVPLLSLLQLFICFVVIVLLSPVGSKNHQLDSTEKKVYGKRARIICYIESTLFLILLFFEASYWYKVILVAELLTALLLVIGKVKE